MNKKIVALLTICIIAVTVNGRVYADGNTSDHPYSFNNTGTSDYTYYRNKENATKVYVHPEYGFTLYYTVQGWNNMYNIGGIDFSGTFDIPIGEYASITNYVYENGFFHARLHMQRYVSYSVNTNTTGQWSPDSTQNYTIYGD